MRRLRLQAVVAGFRFCELVPASEASVSAQAAIFRRHFSSESDSKDEVGASPFAVQTHGLIH